MEGRDMWTPGKNQTKSGKIRQKQAARQQEKAGRHQPSKQQASTARSPPLRNGNFHLTHPFIHHYLGSKLAPPVSNINTQDM